MLIPDLKTPTQFSTPGKPPVFHRSPRDYVLPPENEVKIQNPPALPLAQASQVMNIVISAMGILIMLACSVGIGLVTGNLLYAFMPLAMLPVVVGGGIWRSVSSKKQYTNHIEKRHCDYTNHLKQCYTEIKRLQEVQRSTSIIPNPDPTGCLGRVERRERHLWERSPSDQDFLELRLGIGSAKKSFNIIPPSTPPVGMESDDLYRLALKVSTRYTHTDGVAITIPLQRLGAIGISGNHSSIYATVSCLLIQLATHHSPDQVKIVVTCKESETAEWNWVRWLPHVWNDERSQRYISATPDKARKTLMDLLDLIRKRTSQARITQSNPTAALPAYVFVFTDTQIFSGPESAAISPLIQLILNEGAGVGVFGIFVTENIAQIPQGCKALVTFPSAQGQLTIVGPPREDLTFTPDIVDFVFADQFGRAIAPIRLQSLAKAAELPGMVSLLDLLGVSEVDDITAEEKWQQNEPFASLGVPIGVKAGDEPLVFDIHEKAHGPHGLVAGATGSGKSELLQTIIAVLSVYFSPQELAFILIDYKGGGMANAFRDLPHQIGIITNLDGNQTLRALAAIRSELKRRQRIFDQAGVNQIDKYQQLRRANPGMEPLPHLVIIADEFAELKQNQPEFMKELVSAVRVGRSLGIHLILATQKPSGVVDEQIWGNTRFRLCLRVEQAEDSKEMLKRPDAATLRRPGQGYFQVGMDEVFELFQTGYSGGPYSPGNRSVVGVRDVAQVDLEGKRMRLSFTPKHRVNIMGQTQLGAVVAYLSEVAQNAGIQPVTGPWLPPLPSTLNIQSVRKDPGGWDGQTWKTKIIANMVEDWLSPVLGLVDDPQNQSQRPLHIPLGRMGHLLIYGAPGTGKTTCLQTLISSISQDHSPQEVNFYLLDFGSRLLKQFETLPHTAAVILPDEEERLTRLFKSLLKELDQRKDLLSAAGASNLIAYRMGNPQKTPPDLVVLMDNFSEFYKTYNDLVEPLERISREGGALGVHLVITGVSANAISSRLVANCLMAVTLELTDPIEYSGIVGRTEGLKPERNTPGRGLVRATPPLEFQTALPAEGDTDQERAESLKNLIHQMDQAWKDTRPKTIKILPDVIPLNEILSHSDTWTHPPRNEAGEITDPRYLAVPIGLFADTLEPFEVNLADGPFFAIAGAIGGGKTTLLQTWLLALAEKSPPDLVNLYLLALGDQNLLPFRKLPHTKAVIEDNDKLLEVIKNISAELSERQKVLIDMRKSSDDIINEQAFISRYPALVIACDDYDRFRAACSDSNRKEMEGLFKNRNLGIYLMCAGPNADLSSSSDPAGKVLRVTQTGFAVGTNDSSDMSVLNIMPVRGKRMTPGRAYFGIRGRAQIMQAATHWAGQPSLKEWVQLIIKKDASG